MRKTSFWMTWAVAQTLLLGACGSSPPAHNATGAGGATAGSPGVAGSAGSAGSTDSAGKSGAAGSAGKAGADSGPAPWDGEVPVSAYNPCPAAGTPCSIMPLGDSITFGAESSMGAGYRIELFRSALADSKSLTFVGRQMNGPSMVDGHPFPQGSEGYVGALVDLIAAKGLEAQPMFSPNIVLLHAGTNDIWTADANVDTAPDRLAKLVDDLLAADAKVLVVVATVIPQKTQRDASLAAYNTKLTTLIQAKVDAGKHVVLLNMNAAFAAMPDIDAILVNGVHPNDIGYRLMAGIWYRSIGPLLKAQ